MTRRVYLVQRRALTADLHEAGLEPHTAHPNGGFVPWKALRLFASEAAALAFANEVRAAIRLEVNPFHYCGWDLNEASSHPVDDFWLLAAELGLSLPGEYSYARYEWWYENAPKMTDAQREGVWALLDRLELVRVTPLTLHD
jgi:hypothetical protein